MRGRGSSKAEPTGFAEEGQVLVAPSAGSVPAKQFRLKIGPGGRIVIPAGVRSVLKVKEGDVMVARISDGLLMIEPLAHLIERVQDAFKDLAPAGVSLADELIADRREEARREERNG